MAARGTAAPRDKDQLLAPRADIRLHRNRCPKRAIRVVLALQQGWSNRARLSSPKNVEVLQRDRGVRRPTEMVLFIHWRYLAPRRQPDRQRPPISVLVFDSGSGEALELGRSGRRPAAAAGVSYGVAVRNTLIAQPADGGPRSPLLLPTRACEALMMAGAGGATRARGWRATAIRFQQLR